MRKLKILLFLIIAVIFCTYNAKTILADTAPTCAYICNDGSAQTDDAKFCLSHGETFTPGIFQDGKLLPAPCTGDLQKLCGLNIKPVCCCGHNGVAVNGTLQNNGSSYTAAKAPKFTPPNPEINIPTVALTAVQCTPGGNSYVCEIPWIGEYINGIYKYGINIAGILAAIVLMAGGLLWLVSGGDASKITQAKNLIIGAITGLMILMASYIILTQVNPDLVNMKAIKIGSIEKEIAIENGSDSESNVTSAPCTSNLNNINNLGATIIANDPQLTPAATEGLKKAIAEATKQKVKLQINSAHRSYAVQKSLWDQALITYGSDTIARHYVAPPTQCEGDHCYGHCAGVAIDVCIAGTTSCSHIGGSANAKYSDSDVSKLQALMAIAGWKRYCGEWWHFQYGVAPGQSCSP